MSGGEATQDWDRDGVTEDDAEDDLVVAALGALDAFAAAIASFGVLPHLRRAVVLLAWETARRGELDEAAEGGVDAQMSAEEAALAELGAVAVSAALEAASARGPGGGRPAVGPSAPGRGAGNRGAPWEWLCFRVDSCGRAASIAGVPLERCAELRRLGASLIEPYRADLQPLTPPAKAALARNAGGRDSAPTAAAGGAAAPPAGPAGRAAPAPAAPDVLDDGPGVSHLWVLPQEGAGWRGPFTARQVLRMSETQQLPPDALIYGLDAADAGHTKGPPNPEKAQPLWQSFQALGVAVRRDGEVAAAQRLRGDQY